MLPRLRLALRRDWPTLLGCTVAFLATVALFALLAQQLLA
jgi:hypothetical protein